jgi:hypothetical protein
MSAASRPVDGTTLGFRPRLAPVVGVELASAGMALGGRPGFFFALGSLATKIAAALVGFNFGSGLLTVSLVVAFAAVLDRVGLASLWTLLLTTGFTLDCAVLLGFLEGMYNLGISKNRRIQKTFRAEGIVWLTKTRFLPASCVGEHLVCSPCGKVAGRESCHRLAGPEVLLSLLPKEVDCTSS